MTSIESIIKSNTNGANEEAFFVFNIEDILNKHKKWLKYMPRVIPYYSVKCNNLSLIIEILTGLGLHFDCCSRAEVEAVLSCGNEPNNIIFANACKSPAFIRYVKSVGVELMTFDNEEELIKISILFPKSRLLLRIKVDDSHSSSRLNLKFGANVEYSEYLLKRAKILNLNVVGIAFHVGSDCQSTHSYIDGIKKSRIAFDIGLELGFDMSLLDIGGGFPGSDGSSQLSFKQIACVVNQELDTYFPINDNKLKIIAEPGRYYAMSAFDLTTFIISKRIDNFDNKKVVMYYINDGFYGSFSSVVTGNQMVSPIPLFKDNNNYYKQKPREIMSSVIWGPTCDNFDCVKRDFEMPEMNVGEWLTFKDMGAYSMTIASNFNGMPLPKLKVFVSDNAINELICMKNWHQIEKLIKSLNN